MTVAKAVTGAVPFVHKECILVPKWYILEPVQGTDQVPVTQLLKPFFFLSEYINIKSYEIVYKS